MDHGNKEEEEEEEERRNEKVESVEKEKSA
jgi:hypothetical protein